eukprot:scaffold3759_cov61-Cyclotella_meneghiniana.AAC.6
MPRCSSIMIGHNGSYVVSTRSGSVRLGYPLLRRQICTHHSKKLLQRGVRCPTKHNSSAGVHKGGHFNIPFCSSRM